jgi:hypothetical protein
MSYRKGLQRVYFVLTVMWVTIIFVAVFLGQWKPWNYIQSGDPYAEFGGWQVVSETPAPGLSELQRGIIEAQISHDAQVRNWSWSLCLAILPPLGLYFFVFYVATWVYRGFRPATQI